MDAVTDIPGALPLWRRVSGGSPDIRIAIIDGPVDLAHPALQNGNVMFRAQPGIAAATTVRSEHGTHVSSIVVGNPGSPVVGLAPNCTTTIFSIYREAEDGELEASSQATLALAINRALADRPHLINISSGQQAPTGQAERILTDAVRACARAGTLIVAAAGNDGCRCLQVPAALDSVLAVGACDLNGRALAFSNFGDAYLANGILAPGDSVKGASPREHVALRSGTSFATPIVTGIAALLLSRLLQEGRDPNPSAVRAALLGSAVPCASGSGELRCLAGFLNVPGAVAALFGEEVDIPQRPSPLQPRASPSHADPPRHAQADSVRTVSHSPPTSEGTMGEQSTRAAAAPHILGPDGNVMTHAAVTPSEAPAVPAPPQAAAGAHAGAAPAHEAPGFAAPSPMGGGMVWMPMPSGMAPGWGFAPMGGVMPSAMPQQMLVPTAPQPAMLPAAPAQPAIQSSSASAVQPSAGGCGCGGIRPAQAAAPQLAFPIGRLYYDFGAEARLDYFVQALADWRDGLGGRVPADSEFGPDRDKSGDTAAPYNPEIMVRYLMNLAQGEQQRPSDQDSNLRDANAIIWTLTIDAVPVYAIKPLDVFGLGFYASLILALFAQEVSPFNPGDPRSFVKQNGGYAGEAEKPDVARVSFAGYSDSSTTRLLNGTVVPTLVTDWRGFYQWNLRHILGDNPEAWPDGCEGFLERIYNEFRNVGISPQDRALNYSAMNAHNTRKIFTTMSGGGMRLDTVEVDRSVICRPDSDCWDVTYRFFNPKEVLTQARQVFQYTIDVSDLVPVAVGPLRNWQVY